MRDIEVKLKSILIFFLGCLINLNAQNFSESENDVAWNLQKEMLGQYDEVLGPNKITKEGVFKVHFKDNRLFFEILFEKLGAGMLLVRDRRGFHNVTWKLKDGNVFLSVPDVQSVTGNTIISNRAAKKLIEPSLPSIIQGFPVLAMGKGKTVIIEVTPLFFNELDGFLDNGENIDLKSSFIENVRINGETIEIEVVETIAGAPGSLPVTFKSHWSLAPLPEISMKPRLYDPRMGFRREDGILSREIKPYKAAIIRWKLEKKEPSKAISEPKTPIVFYLDPQIPEKWKKWVREGIYAWLPAFRAAGFKNAIKVLDQPENDPDWSVADLNYSSVRWSGNKHQRRISRTRSVNPGTGTVNTVIDMRTGEILKADIFIGPPFGWGRYFIRTAPLDNGSKALPLPDEVIGQLIKSLVSHEAGHAFGLIDGHYGEYAYPFEKMRSPVWLKKMGHTPSVMNYARENYMIQPGDSISPVYFHQKVGPTDIYNIIWGYTPFDPGVTIKQKQEFLDSLIRIQDSIHWYQFTNPNDIAGPDATSEVLGNNNPIKTTKLGIKNLKRVLNLLPAAVDGDFYNYYLEYLYYRILDQWVNEMKHVTSLIGGIQRQYKSKNQQGSVYLPVSGAVQRKAMEFLAEEVFETPFWLAEKSITSRFEAEGTLLNISSIQTEIMEELLEVQRIKNLAEIELWGKRKSVFTRKEMFKIIREAVWSELQQEEIKINPFRQELQQVHLFILKRILDKKIKPRGDIERSNFYPDLQISAFTRGLIIADMELLYKNIETALTKKVSAAAKGHLISSRNILDGILN